MPEIAFLPILPRGFWLSISIRACAHNAGHSFAKAFPNGRFIACAAILDDIVQQPGDSLVFIATMF
jgi:hypothetical protein